MTDWIARARAEIFESGQQVTAKTDESCVLAVSSVPPECSPELNQQVSSALSVLGCEALGKLLSVDLIEAAMKVCDQHGDDVAGQEEMRRQCMNLPLRLQLDLLEHFTGMAWRGQWSFPSSVAQPLSAPETLAPARLQVSATVTTAEHDE